MNDHTVHFLSSNKILLFCIIFCQDVSRRRAGEQTKETLRSGKTGIGIPWIIINEIGSNDTKNNTWNTMEYHRVIIRK